MTGRLTEPSPGSGKPKPNQGPIYRLIPNSLFLPQDPLLGSLSTSTFEPYPKLPPWLKECSIKSSAASETTGNLRSSAASEAELNTSMGLVIGMWAGGAMAEIGSSIWLTSSSSSTSMSSS